MLTATGDVYEDVVHARAVAQAGGDIIAVIRSTAQSLLDYVPYGPTTEGYGGTFATQANFRIMREAMDEWSEQHGRYVRLSSFCSGLCMSEIAAMGAWEGFDNMVNDALYGILYRDINIVRGLIDQRVSRMINGYFGVVINTGEDNYLRTADAIEAAPSVTASQFINHQLARDSGVPDAQIGLGDAFEIDVPVTNGLLLEWAQAQLTRELFPDCPVKYMPPTRHMDGNLFRTHAADALFNLVTIATGQGIQTIGVPTEGIFTPHIHDRVLGLQNVDYVFNAARDLGEEIEFKRGGIIQTRAQEVLAGAHELLERIAETGLFEAIDQATFGDVSRTIDEGRGIEGIVQSAPELHQPRHRADAGGQLCLAELDLTAVRPYADHLGDGLVQMSFTLPVPYSLAARRAALELAGGMGFEEPEVVHYEELTEGYTYFVMYGRCAATVDFEALQGEGFDIEYMSEDEVERFADEHIGRPIVVVGASTGSDTHSVGIDAMLNLKGYHGHHGLEGYSCFQTYNLGSQVPNSVLLAKAIEVGADAILVSQTVTQQNLHVHNLTELVEMVEAEGLRGRMILACGGPRVTNELAKELGYDAGFSKGT